MRTTEPEIIHVAVGVLCNEREEVLVSLRHADSHQGGLWEFPGGKLEAGESVLQGLVREFAEELDLQVLDCSPLMQLTHHYPDKSVLLDVWMVDRWSGEARGMEGQSIRWQKPESMKSEEFPVANVPIIRRLNLPSEIVITPDTGSWTELLPILESWLQQQLPFILFRQSGLDQEQYIDWFKRALDLCAGACTLIFHGDLAAFHRLPPSQHMGYHCNSSRLAYFQERPVSNDVLLSAACHDMAELQQAGRLGADFAFLSPVHPVARYGGGAALGWAGFADLSKHADLPVYALGGIQRSELETARDHGARGIAGIGAFLPGGE